MGEAPEKNVLFMIEGGIGHHFICTPTIRAIKEQGCRMIVMCGFPAVFEKNPYVDEIAQLGGHPAPLEALYKRVHGNFECYNPSLYKDLKQHTNTRHIKEQVGLQCGVEVSRKDKLLYYPIDMEVAHVRGWKQQATRDGKLKMGVLQVSGSGIGQNPTAQLKQIPIDTISQVVDETKDRVFWVQVRLKHEPQIPGIGYDAVDHDQRILFAMMGVADFGLGTDSFAQHVMCGVYEKPFLMLLGRSRAENYAHPTCRVIANPKSCKYFGCEFPFLNSMRLCQNLDCMTSIKPEQIKTELMKIL